MDTLSHTLWGYGLFGYKRYAVLAMLFGAFPDLISFGTLMVIRLIEGTMQFGKPPLETLPQWLYLKLRNWAQFFNQFTDNRLGCIMA